MTAIVVHGGAGEWAPERHARAREGVRRAAAAGDAILAAGGSALDAVCAAVRLLEDDPEFNAGIGSALTRDGTVETDAAVMDGTSQRIGAVGAVPDLGCAVALARAVLDRGEHVLLAGTAAWRFAAEVGIAPAPPGALVTERARARLASKGPGSGGGGGGGGPGFSPPNGGTVGAVARDVRGALAAATSTGGMAGKRAGRIGDSPIPGAGTWADRACAVSATGDGEAILRVALARGIAARVAAGAAIDAAVAAALDAAVAAALAELRAVTGATAGAIAVSPHGWTALQLSPAMPIAAVVDGVATDSMGRVA